MTFLCTYIYSILRPILAPDSLGSVQSALSNHCQGMFDEALRRLSLNREETDEQEEVMIQKKWCGANTFY